LDVEDGVGGGGGGEAGGEGGGGEGFGLQGLSHAEHIVHAIWYLDEVCGTGVAIAGRDTMIIRRDIRGSFVVNTWFLAVPMFWKLKLRTKIQRIC
jgi:hypothetical protein